ncbi:MAG TPA: hypothetical protein PKC70_12410, partial [Cellvibrionaceae bacterium]|nr:hypothetical protein [Cellvibrionaceae bacterium]
DGGVLALGDLVVDGMTHTADPDGGFGQVAARVLDLDALSAGLNAHLLEPVSTPLDLGDVRAAYTGALQDARLAMVTPGPQGELLRVDPATQETLGPDVLALTNALLDSLPAGALPVNLDNGTVVRLGAALDMPPGHALLVSANGGVALTAVVPGNPEKSWLYLKASGLSRDSGVVCQGNASCSKVMPGLSGQNIQDLYDWIKSGAPAPTILP